MVNVGHFILTVKTGSILFAMVFLNKIHKKYELQTLQTLATKTLNLLNFNLLSKLIFYFVIKDQSQEASTPI